MKNFLLFGARGTIGAACEKKLSFLGNVIRAERDQSLLEKQLSHIQIVDGVIWAQGQNLSDSIETFQIENFNKILEANLLFILQTAKKLVENKKIDKGSNLIVVSSIWSQLSKKNKLTYSISKAACHAAVKSMAVDLGELGIQVNSIAPGPIDSDMTKQNLSLDQIKIIENQTPLQRLVTLEEVANVITRFANGEMSGITGQEIVIDGGWGVSKLVEN